MHLFFCSPCFALIFQVLPLIQSLQPPNFKVDGAISGRRVDHLVRSEEENGKVHHINVEDFSRRYRCFPNVVDERSFLPLRRIQLSKILHLQSAALKLTEVFFPVHENYMGANSSSGPQLSSSNSVIPLPHLCKLQ